MNHLMINVKIEEKRLEQVRKDWIKGI